MAVGMETLDAHERQIAMSTKAEKSRYRAERSGPGKPKKPKAPRRDKPVDTSLPGVSASARKVGPKGTAKRNRSEHAAGKAAYALENSATGKPSRKSTRASANRAKPTSNLKRRATRTTRDPKQRARKAAAAE